MAILGQYVAYCAIVSLVLVAILIEPSGAEEQEKRMDKRAINEDWKRGGQGSYISALENALGSMQRPRFGKRFSYDAPAEDGPFYNEKRGRSLMEMENALSSLQRPRFGRSMAEKSRR